MIKACRENNVKLNIGFQRRFSRSLRMAKEILDRKVIGDVFHMNIQGLWYRKEPYFLNSTPVPENEDEELDDDELDMLKENMKFNIIFTTGPGGASNGLLSHNLTLNDCEPCSNCI